MASTKTATRNKGLKELRECIEVTLMEHMFMDKEVQVSYLEYDTWMGKSRKMIIRSKRAGEDVILSSDRRSMLFTNGYATDDSLPPLPKEPLKMVERAAEKMGLKVVPSKRGELVIRK
jgi:hypothetical protein